MHGQNNIKFKVVKFSVCLFKYHRRRHMGGWRYSVIHS